MPEVKDSDLERRVYLSLNKYKEASDFFASVVSGEGGSLKLAHHAAFSTLLYMFKTLTLAREYNQYFKNKTVQELERGLSTQFDELRSKFLNNLID